MRSMITITNLTVYFQTGFIFLETKRQSGKAKSGIIMQRQAPGRNPRSKSNCFVGIVAKPRGGRGMGGRGMGGRGMGGRGMGGRGMGGRGMGGTPHSALRTPHSAFRTPRSALRVPHSAFRVPAACFQVGNGSSALLGIKMSWSRRRRGILRANRPFSTPRGAGDKRFFGRSFEPGSGQRGPGQCRQGFRCEMRQ
jgi:hypothetical protein